MTKNYKVGYIFEEEELPYVAKYCNENNDLIMIREYDSITKDEKTIKRYRIFNIPVNILETRVRNKRNIYLEQYIDKLASNPLRWNDLSYEEKENLSEYRRYLLDYPQQKDWYKKYPQKYDEWKSSK